jgi:hypothetical protein
MDERRIGLEEPKVVPMHRRDRAEAARLLAALILAARRSREAPVHLPRTSHGAASPLPLGPGASGKPADREAAGGAG